MQSTGTPVGSKTPDAKPARLHYLDWLRVLAILGVFLFHAVHPFDMFPWEIKNAEKSIAATLFIVFLAPWGMPLFFFLSGGGSWFALQRRTGRQFINERVKRLLIPFIAGSLLLSPIQLYFQWRQQMQLALFDGTLLMYFKIRELSVGPRVFGWAGYHLWFLGFLFSYALIALPVFQWLKREGGKSLIDWMARVSGKRGGLLLFILPLVLIQYLFRPFFPAEHDWTDFIFMLVFFIYGYIMFSDERFSAAVRRDWPIMLILGIASTLFYFGVGAADLATEWMEIPGSLGYYLVWAVWGVSSFCWTIFTWYIGMRYLDFTNKWLQYGQDTIMPFFLFHQPVIIMVAFFVVQWEVSVLLKMLVVIPASFAITAGFVEYVIRRIKPIRVFLGMKSVSGG
jgi:peptidoglycan/LPS O-acetylase OafA/YrhL